MKEETSLTTTNELSDSAKDLVAFSQTNYNQFGLQSFENNIELKSLFEQSCQAHLKSGIQMGFYGLQLKEALEHGAFEDYLKRLGMPSRTLRSYMQVAKKAVSLFKTAESAVLSDEKPSPHYHIVQRYIKQPVAVQLDLAKLSNYSILSFDEADWKKTSDSVVSRQKLIEQKIKTENENNRENILENKLNKVELKNTELKHKLELAEGKRTNIDPNVFYYAKQSTLLVEEASQVALGFEEILNEFHLDTDPAKAKIWEKVAVDLFMSYQGALAKFLASFNRIKAAIPPEFQTEQSARINAYDEEMILEMSSVLDTYRASNYAKPQLRQHVALTAAKKVK